MALPHPYGRLQFGADLDLHFRTMIGTGANPNVADCVVIGIEPGWTDKIVQGIAATEPVQSRKPQRILDPCVEGVPVFRVEEIEAATEYPLFTLGLDTEALARVHAPQSLLRMV